jgi:hypothetical protein
MNNYFFTLELSGKGDTEEEAWTDAVESLTKMGEEELRTVLSRVEETCWTKEHPCDDHPFEDWLHEVANNYTESGYSTWVCHQLEMSRYE